MVTCQTDKQIADTLLIAADGLTNATPLEFLLPLLKFFLLLFGYEMPIHSSFAMAKESGNGKKIHLFIHPFKIFLKIKKSWSVPVYVSDETGRKVSIFH